MKICSGLFSPATTVVVVCLITGLPSAWAESVASKNAEGNRLFSQGKFQDAEKAYLDAEVKSPGRPELLYNLGNSLIKQRKYDQALQSLREAIAKADKGLQESSWYNIGNALFEISRYSEAAQAYVQALRLNTADADAKHNLELALKKKQEQQASSNNNQGDRNKQNEPQQGQNKESSQQPDRQNSKPESPEAKDQNKPANPQSTQAEQKEGSINKERAIQILDALQSQELAEQRKLLERRARQKTGARDW
jgi:Ca-activated chloride channel homolog